MWTEEKQRQFDDLWQRKFESGLTQAEESNLTLLLEEMDREEAEALIPFFTRSAKEQQEMQAEIMRLQKKKTLLAAIAEQEEQLLKRAKALLQELQGERQRLRQEYEQALAEESRVA